MMKHTTKAIAEKNQLIYAKRERKIEQIKGSFNKISR